MVKLKGLRNRAVRSLRRYPSLYRLIVRIYGLGNFFVLLLCRHHGSSNYLKCYLSAILRQEASWGSPILLTIEPTNICDQRCTICETGLGLLGRKPQNMSYDKFQYILDQFDNNLRILYFYFMGESFLNPHAYKMIRYAADRGIYVTACTNGNHIDAEQLVRSGIAEIQFQIAGTTPEIHTKYRVGGNLRKVVENLEETLEWRRQLAPQLNKNRYPLKVITGFILLRPNEHQVQDFKRMCKELGVDECQIIDPCVRTIEQGVELLPTDKSHWVYDPEAFKNGELRPRVRPNNHCEWIYSTVTIQVNGDVVPCCRDPKGKRVLGNVFKEDIYDIWNGKQFRKLRRSVATRQSELSLCSLCEGYGMPKLPQVTCD